MPDAVEVNSDMRIKRIILGVLTCLMGLVALWLNVFDSSLGDSYAAFQSGSVRMTAVLAVLWLALPEASKLGPVGWMITAATIAAIVMLPRLGKAWIKLLVPAIALLGLLNYLRRFTAALSGKPPRDRRPR